MYRQYSKKEEKELVNLYMNEGYDVYQLADHFNKTHRSIIMKLVTLKVYEMPAKKKPVFRKDLIKRLEDSLGIDFIPDEKSQHIDLHRKDNLMMLHGAIKKGFHG